MSYVTRERKRSNRSFPQVVEEQWAGTEKNRHPNGPYLGSFAITKACYFNPFSVPQHTSKKERNDLMEFFIEAQIDEIDPLKLVTVMTFHPETEMRNQGLSLGCMVLQEAFSDLQSRKHHGAERYGL